MSAVAIIALLILTNGFFVLAEFALVSAPRATMEHLAATGNSRARQVRDILNDPRQQDRYIATAQVGITCASLGLGMYGEHAMAEWLRGRLAFLDGGSGVGVHTLASLLALLFLTYFHIVVGEMAAKSIALQKSDRAALWITPPLVWIERLFYPLVALLNLAGNAILRLARIRRQRSSAHFYTPEELQIIVRESLEGGALAAESGEIIRELFEFGGLTAHEVMVPRIRIVGIPLGTTPEGIRTVLRTSGFTRYPVLRGDLDHLVGMVHIKDLMRLLLQDIPLSLSDVRPLQYIPESSRLDSVLSLMRREHSQMVVVMDEFGGTAGLITLEDLFEEVVGEIDEGGQELPPIQRERGRFRVQGTVRVEELGEVIGTPLEHAAVDTISGLVLALLERPALVGDIVTYGPVRIQVVAVDGPGVRECLVFPVESLRQK